MVAWCLLNVNYIFVVRMVKRSWDSKKQIFGRTVILPSWVAPFGTQGKAVLRPYAGVRTDLADVGVATADLSFVTSGRALGWGWAWRFEARNGAHG